MTESRRWAGRIYVTSVLAWSMLAALPSACSTSTITIGQEEADAGGVTPLAPADASQSDSGQNVGLCPTAECPPGRTTCPTNPFPCAVDLLTDNANCGECGNECPALVGGTSSCVNGTCALRCADSLLDCNGYVEDGCEVSFRNNNNNCGGCGVVCPDLHYCDDLECVCAIKESCGTCGNICPPPDPNLPVFPPEWNAGYGCSNGLCNQPVCKSDYADCNHNFPDPTGDGCEIYTLTDPKNCGGCGLTCVPGEVCAQGECICPCGSACFKRLEYDPTNCGACNIRCPDVSNGEPVCDHGICDYRCNLGHADCDHDSLNGCEANILSDPLNCGGCGHRCDGVDGQACVDGQCTVTECTIR